MAAVLFIYFPRGPGQNIYIKVFDGQDIYFKKTAKPFPNSTDCHTKHIAMPHVLWPSKI